MTEKEKSILIKDLGARIPYRVEINVTIEDPINNHYANFNDNLISIDVVNDIINDEYSVEDIKPKLFPMSSMTEEQREEFNSLTDSVFIDDSLRYCDNENKYADVIYSDIEDWIICIDWLNKHHFDYRGLIDKGLAIDATNLNIYGSNR